MGSIFMYVADQALSAEGSQCHHCETEEEPVYLYDGVIVDPELAKSPETARDEPEVSELCANCIFDDNTRHEEDVAEHNIESYAHDKAAMWEAYHQLPDSPEFIQNWDWPLCCGEFCEFMGHPADESESVEAGRTRLYWEGGPKSPPYPDEDLLPEDEADIGLFDCLTCEKKFYTFQGN